MNSKGNAIIFLYWAKMIGMRHRLVHDYDAVDLDVVWDTVNFSIPPLIADLERILEEGEAS